MSSSGLTADSLVARSGGFLTAEIDDEVVALSIEKGQCYSLNKTGSRIWNLIEGPTRIEDICKALAGRYDVDRDSCEREVLALLEELRAEGMIETPAKA